ncbi:hypothetical protein V865_002811 [Kwoniella europaea PYCC6329]|uniref:Uncharacterized protein n=1 Tax=Kwoniella europaea PYCC6329 TaxID=1423913 RepID=A0AAX4KGP6_9TREE
MPSGHMARDWPNLGRPEDGYRVKTLDQSELYKRNMEIPNRYFRLFALLRLLLRNKGFEPVWNFVDCYPQITTQLETKDWDERERMNFNSLVNWKLKDDIGFPDCLTIKSLQDLTKTVNLPSVVKIVHLELYPKPATHPFPGAGHFTHSIHEVKGFTYALRSVNTAGRHCPPSKYRPKSRLLEVRTDVRSPSSTPPVRPVDAVPSSSTTLLHWKLQDGQATLTWLEVNRPSVHDVLVSIAQIGVWGMGDAIEKNMWDLLVKLDKEHKVKLRTPEAIPNMEGMIAQLEREYEQYRELEKKEVVTSQEICLILSLVVTEGLSGLIVS